MVSQKRVVLSFKSFCSVLLSKVSGSCTPDCEFCSLQLCVEFWLPSFGPELRSSALGPTPISHACVPPTSTDDRLEEQRALDDVPCRRHPSRSLLLLTATLPPPPPSWCCTQTCGLEALKRVVSLSKSVDGLARLDTLHTRTHCTPHATHKQAGKAQ